MLNPERLIINNRISRLKPVFNNLYHRFNNQKFVSPDPLQFLYDYESESDREIAGLIAAALAYGHVKQICKSVLVVLSKFQTPSEFLKDSSTRKIKNSFKDFKHRFTNGDDISNLLLAIKRNIKKYGSLENCFMDGFNNTDASIIPALEEFTVKLTKSVQKENFFLLPKPSKKSACKRMNLYLKWMVRKDNVDPGCWAKIPRSKLIVPVDTHINRICGRLGFTNRKTADLKTALVITDMFKQLSPNDPTKYDFALTRLGMQNTDEIDKFYKDCGINDG